ncbi:MAG: ExbD/TolR family protein [Myxococcota bacterium]
MTRPGGDGFSATTGTFSHPDVAYFRKKRRPRLETESPEESGELNIVPYLDIIVNLIIFLLVIQAVLVSVGMIDVTAPTYASLTRPPPEPGEKENKLNLTVGVALNGFYIAATGGVLPGQTEEEQTKQLTAEEVQQQPPTIPLRPDGSYDFETLARKLRTIKEAFPKTNAVNIAADKEITYDLIVKTLDTSREDARGELFPGVVFTKF